MCNIIAQQLNRLCEKCWTWQRIGWQTQGKPKHFSNNNNNSKTNGKSSTLAGKRWNIYITNRMKWANCARDLLEKCVSFFFFFCPFSRAHTNIHTHTQKMCVSKHLAATVRTVYTVRHLKFLSRIFEQERFYNVRTIFICGKNVSHCNSVESVFVWQNDIIVADVNTQHNRASHLSCMIFDRWWLFHASLQSTFDMSFDHL